MLYKNKVINPVAYEDTVSVLMHLSHPGNRNKFFFFFSFWTYQVLINVDYHAIYLVAWFMSFKHLSIC